MKWHIGKDKDNTDKYDKDDNKDDESIIFASFIPYEYIVCKNDSCLLRTL